MCFVSMDYMVCGRYHRMNYEVSEGSEQIRVCVGMRNMEIEYLSCQQLCGATLNCRLRLYLSSTLQSQIQRI